MPQAGPHQFQVADGKILLDFGSQFCMQNLIKGLANIQEGSCAVLFLPLPYFRCVLFYELAGPWSVLFENQIGGEQFLCLFK